MITGKTTLEALRKQNNMTQEEVAEYLNISRNTLAAYESGKSKIPLSVFIYLSDLYKCDVFTMLGVYADNIEYDMPEIELIKAHAKHKIKAEKAKDDAYGKAYFPDKYYADRYKKCVEETLKFYKFRN